MWQAPWWGIEPQWGVGFLACLDNQGNDMKRSSSEWISSNDGKQTGCFSFKSSFEDIYFSKILQGLVGLVLQTFLGGVFESLISSAISRYTMNTDIFLAWKPDAKIIPTFSGWLHLVSHCISFIDSSRSYHVALYWKKTMTSALTPRIDSDIELHALLTFSVPWNSALYCVFLQCFLFNLYLMSKVL